MQVWEGDHVGYNECHSFLFDIYFYYIVVQKKNVPSDVFEAIHQGLDGICFFNSWEFIFSSAAGVRAPVSCLQDCHRLTFSYSWTWRAGCMDVNEDSQACLPPSNVY